MNDSPQAQEWTDRGRVLARRVDREGPEVGLWRDHGEVAVERVQRRLEAQSGEGIEVGAAEVGEGQVARVGEATGVAPRSRRARR